MDNNPTIRLQLKVLDNRDKAIQVEYQDEKFWLPKSQVPKLESHDAPRRIYNVTVYEWLWNKKLQEIESGEMAAQRKRYAQDAAIKKKQAERRRKNDSSENGGLSGSSLAD